MKVLKGITVSICSFILFVFVLVFGVVFMLNSTALNPDFVTSRIDNLEMAELIDEYVEVDASPETEQAVQKIKDTLPDIEPDIKEGINTVVNSVYDYLLDNKDTLDVKETMGDSFLNAEFVSSILEKISLPEMIEIVSNGEGNEEMPEEFIQAMKEVIADMEPEIKAEAANILTPIFDYILDETSSLDMMQVLRDTVLNEEFIVPLIEKLDLSAIAQELITGQIKDQIPQELAFLTEYVGPAVDALEPTLKQEFRAAAGPFIDYMTGETQHISVYISLDTVIDTLQTELKKELQDNPPAELSGFSQSEIEAYFDDSFLGKILDFLPATFEVDESVIGPDVVGSFTGVITDMEDAITDVKVQIDDTVTTLEDEVEGVKDYVSWFKLAYLISIAVIAVMIVIIILVLRDVKAITRTIGIPLLINGIIEYAGILIGKNIYNNNVPFPEDLPESVQTLINDLVNSVVRPMEIYSLAMLIVGVILVLVSIFYRRQSKESTPIKVQEIEPASIQPEEPESGDDEEENR